MSTANQTIDVFTDFCLRCRSTSCVCQQRDTLRARQIAKEERKLRRSVVPALSPIRARKPLPGQRALF